MPKKKRWAIPKPAAILAVLALVSGAGFIFGRFILSAFLSGFFVGMRGGVWGMLLAALVFLITLGLARVISERTAVPFYALAAFGSIPYQTALLFDGTLRASVVRCLFQIVLLAGMLAFLAFRRIRPGAFVIFLIWALIGLVSLFGPDTPDYAWMLYVVGIILPGVFFLLVHSYLSEGGSLERLSLAFSVGTAVVLVGEIVVMLVSTSVKTYSIALSRSASDLNYGAGLLILGWPFLTWKWRDLSLPLRVFVLVLAFFVGLFSFSRGTMLIVLFLFAVTFARKRMLKTAVVPFLALAAAVVLALPSSIPAYWMERLNVGRDNGRISQEELELSKLALSTRPEIWDLAVASFRDEPILGNGLGSFAALSSEATGGEIENVDAHSLILTVAAERGVVGLIPAVFIVLTIFFKLFGRWRTAAGEKREFYRIAFLSFVGFLLFAHTTGAEFFRAGTVWVDSVISFFLAAYLVIATEKGGSSGFPVDSPLWKRGVRGDL